MVEGAKGSPVSSLTRASIRIHVWRSKCTVLLIAILVSVTPFFASSALADSGQLDSGAAELLLPFQIGGFTGDEDERDADVYPDVAYDPVTDRFLVVWMSLHRADSSSDGFDVYGRFLNRDAIQMGAPFLISDSNSAARNSLPSVSAGKDGFLVVWARKGYRCSLMGQVVTDSREITDQEILEGDEHIHSPDIAYDRERNRFVTVYTDGNDYQSPMMFGSDADDCGADQESDSRIGYIDITLKNGKPVVGDHKVLSEVNGGAFRPSIAYNPFADQYLAVWEDRRAAYGTPELYEVYSQQLNGDLSLRGSNVRIAGMTDYGNSDESANWTPRPSVIGNDNGYLVSWFERAVSGGAHDLVAQL